MTQDFPQSCKLPTANPVVPSLTISASEDKSNGFNSQRLIFAYFRAVWNSKSSNTKKDLKQHYIFLIPSANFYPVVANLSGQLETPKKEIFNWGIGFIRLWESLWSISLISNWCFRAQTTLSGTIIPRKVDLGCKRKVAELHPGTNQQAMFLHASCSKFLTWFPLIMD